MRPLTPDLAQENAREYYSEHEVQRREAQARQARNGSMDEGEIETNEGKRKLESDLHSIQSRYCKLTPFHIIKNPEKPSSLLLVDGFLPARCSRLAGDLCGVSLLLSLQALCNVPCFCLRL